MDHEHPEILPLPWVNPVIADRLEDEEGNRVESPREVTEASSPLRDGPEGGDRAAALPGRPAPPHGWLMGSNEGRRGPARPDAKLTAAKYYNHAFAPDWREKGGRGSASPTTAATPLLGAGALRPGSPEDALILDGPTDPVPQDLLRVGALRKHRQRLRPPGQRDDVRKRLNEHTRTSGSGRDIHPPSHQGPHAVVVAALQAGVQPSRDLVDLVQMTINQKLNPRSNRPQDIVFLVAEAAGFEGRKPSFR